MVSKSATVKIDELGRVTIPIEVRRALEIDGESVYAEIEVKIDE